ncbi:MAG: peptidoglycan DD-metalloendopeptidase family protein [Pseudomonadota bacterium]|nr:peptidoglycan DD-metalloendopeptidase family protein [Pseudomonadota bacterium]
MTSTLRTLNLLIVTSVLLTAVAIAPVQAKRIYQYRDSSGILHFTDQKPNSGSVTELKETVVQAERQNIVEMFMYEERETSNVTLSHSVTLQNRWRGPVAVELTMPDSENAASAPAMPMRTVLSPLERRQVALVFPNDRRQSARFNVAYRAVPGDIDARHDNSHRYATPLPAKSFQLAQGPGGEFSHHEAQSRYAYDLAADEGTSVMAARDGVVMQVERDFYGNGLDLERFGDRANSVRVLHNDGSMGVYAHLKWESVMVSPGQRVRSGQQLGLSGNTGFSSGPHLHFVVQVNRNMELVSVPIEFAVPL